MRTRVMTQTEVAAAPAGAPQRLLAARSVAVDALLDAEDLEDQARRARRVATARLRHYENMVAEYRGQLRLPLDA
jgi:hypothetical protein